MDYTGIYRNPSQCQAFVRKIKSEAVGRFYKIMEVCGTHTAAIRRFGIGDMLSQNIRLISGPGCPVCVTSDGYLKNAVQLSRDRNILLVTYPDMLRVPAGSTSLEEERAKGADVRSVTSALEALDWARRFPNKEVVFLAVGFETTAPGTAILLKMAQKEKLKNLSVYCGHKTIPEALRLLAADRDLGIQGFLLPGHVSAIIGLSGYGPVKATLKIPSVISGFEPQDILLSLAILCRAINAREVILKNEYTRVVRPNGNPKAKDLLKRVFEKKDSVWRGLGVIAESGLALKKKFRAFDAERKFCLKSEPGDVFCSKCRCADILKGKAEPLECSFFAKSCTPEKPKGPCMVSREGTCRSFFEYR